MAFAFLSHRNVDKPRIADFARKLVEAGVPVWIDRPEDVGLDDTEARGIEKGESWPSQIDVALMAASVVVVFWSKAWSREAAIAALEYQVALSRSRAGHVTFFPVFLDPEVELDPDIRKLRADLHDDTQGFNVAAHGDAAWAKLVAAVAAKVAKAPAPARFSSMPRRPLPTPRIDWRRVVRERHDRDVVLDAIASLPLGPGLNSFHVRFAIVDAFANAASALQASGAVGEANLLVYEVTAFPKGEERRYIVTQGSVPDPYHVGLEVYWGEVFSVACPLGPRMVAALVLSAPGQALDRVEDEAVRLLEYLESLG